MQLSAIWFAQEVKKMPLSKRRFDVVLSSSFVDLATLRILLEGIEGWERKTKFCTYFHENQFAYPNKIKDEESYQYQALNFTTALASDRIAFNSFYNMESFYKNCRKYLDKSVDMNIAGVLLEIQEKSIVLSPGIDFSALDALPDEKEQEVPVIIWNHRWEHDKNPEEFFAVLYELQDQNVPFNLIVVGQSFRDIPACFPEARMRLKRRILHFGFIESRYEYMKWLKRGGVVVSTAFQEFFGISILEAVRAGCLPLVPDRLSYRELFDQRYLYKEGELPVRLTALLHENCRLKEADRNGMTNKFQWDTLKKHYEEWLLS